MLCSSETTFAIYSGGGGVAIGCCQLRMPPEHAVGAARALVDGLAPKRVIVLSQQALQLSTREDIGGVFSLRTDVWPSDCALPEPMAPGVPLAGLEAALLSCCQARAIQAAALCQPLSRPVVDGSDLLELAAATSSVLAACGLERDGQAVSEAAKSIATAEDAAAAHHSTNTVYM